MDNYEYVLVDSYKKDMNSIHDLLNDNDFNEPLFDNFIEDNDLIKSNYYLQLSNNAKKKADEAQKNAFKAVKIISNSNFPIRGPTVDT